MPISVPFQHLHPFQALDCSLFLARLTTGQQNGVNKLALRWSGCALAPTYVEYHICNHSVFHSCASLTDSFLTVSLFGLPNKCTSNCHRSCCQCEQSASTRTNPPMALVCTFVLCWHGSNCAAFGCEQQLIHRCRISNQSVPTHLYHISCNDSAADARATSSQ